MPEFDLRGMKAAKYNYSKATKKITYGEVVDMGEAMTANRSAVDLRKPSSP